MMMWREGHIAVLVRVLCLREESGAGPDDDFTSTQGKNNPLEKRHRIQAPLVHACKASDPCKSCR